MPGTLAGNDRPAAVPDPGPTTALAAALDRLHLQGAIFLRGEYTEGWAYESMPSSGVATILAPGAPQVVLFHVVASGRCWIETNDSDRHWAAEGDVIVLPYNDQHRMGGSTPANTVSIATLLQPPPWQSMPVIRHGAGGRPTKLVCGYLACDDPLFNPRLRAFPSVFVVTPPPGPARDWVRASIDFALQQTAQVSADRVEAPTRVPELLLVEVLKLHLASTPASDQGWIRALHDPVLAPALAAVHGSPELKWGVTQLAREAGVSASLLDERFREVLGLAPIRYLTEWRMHVAGNLLRTSDLGIASVARRVGYQSEEAFSRAFKRAHGAAPSVWRVQRPR